MQKSPAKYSADIIGFLCSTEGHLTPAASEYLARGLLVKTIVK